MNKQEKPGRWLHKHLETIRVFFKSLMSLKATWHVIPAILKPLHYGMLLFMTVLQAKQLPPWAFRRACWQKIVPAGLDNCLYAFMEGWGGSQDSHLRIQPPAECCSIQGRLGESFNSLSLEKPSSLLGKEFPAWPFGGEVPTNPRHVGNPSSAFWKEAQWTRYIPRVNLSRITLWFVTGTLEGALDIVYPTPGEGILATDAFWKRWNVLYLLEDD